MLDNDMGNAKNITSETFSEAAKAANQSIDEAKKNTYEQLKKEVGA